MNETHRHSRDHSFSSTETYLEASSSPSPPPSVVAAARAPLVQRLFPDSPPELPPLGLGLLHDNVAFTFPSPFTAPSPSKGITASTVDGQRARVVVDELHGEDTGEGDDDLELIWDPEPPFDADGDKVGHAACEHEDALGILMKRAKLPQTMGFHFDWWIARIATAAENIDFKGLCASVMLWREKNEVTRIPTCRVRSLQAPRENGSPAVGLGMQGLSARPPKYGTEMLRNPDGSLASMTDWDVLLGEMQQASRKMHQTRKWRMRGLKNAAGWCKWGWTRREVTRGVFVEDWVDGLEAASIVEGVVGIEKGMIKLGYRRESPMMVLSDWETEAEVVGAMFATGDAVEGEDGQATSEESKEDLRS